MADAMDYKRRLTKRIVDLHKELNTPGFETLLGIRTSLLEEYGKDLAKAVEHLKSILPKEKEF